MNPPLGQRPENRPTLASFYLKGAEKRKNTRDRCHEKEGQRENCGEIEMDFDNSRMEKLKSLPKVLTYLPLTLTLSPQAGRGEKGQNYWQSV
jgi:hypothetical protein